MTNAKKIVIQISILDLRYPFGYLNTMEVLFYKSASGRSPIRIFIEDQPEEDQARILNVLDEIENHGFAAARVTFKPIEGKLWEIKFHSVGGGYRILYITVSSNSIVWLHLFKKKTQKTPMKDLKIARSRMKEIL